MNQHSPANSKSRRVILLRHAKSDWPLSVADLDRPLAKRGRRQAPLVAREMARQKLFPQLALISPARRTRETWDLIRPELSACDERIEPAIYEAAPEDILEVVRSLDDKIATLLLVGHNPGFEDLMRYLAPAVPGMPASDEKFPTAAVAVIDFARQNWKDITGQSGTLTAFFTPAQLEG